MVTSVSVNDVAEFRRVIADYAIDRIRTGEGKLSATMVFEGIDRVAVVTCGPDLTASVRSEIADVGVVAQPTSRSSTGTSCSGPEAGDPDLRATRPTTFIFAKVATRSRATTFVPRHDEWVAVAEELGLRQMIGRPVATSGMGPRSRRTLREETGEAAPETRASSRSRGFDSRQVVAACLEYVKASGDHRPLISELSRVALASESRLRQAFVDVVGVSPTRFFQIRLLSIYRNELMVADEECSTVTRIGSSLGLTQLGRAAGRYRALFGETPSQTLRRHNERALLVDDRVRGDTAAPMVLRDVADQIVTVRCDDLVAPGRALGGAFG